MEKIVIEWDESTSNKAEFLIASDINSSRSVKEDACTNGSRKITLGSEWLDYVALNSALNSGLKKAVKLLLQNNCSVNLPSALEVPNDTPLHNGVLLGDIDLVHCLLSKGAFVTAVNCEGDTPLHLAFIRQQDHLVDLILSFIDKISNYVNPKNSQGLTHLHIASTRKNAELVENFLRAGASCQDSVNADSLLWPGYTALNFAIEFGSPDVARVLQRAIGETTKGRNFQTAIQFAYKKVKDFSIMVHMLSAENHFLNFGYFTYPSYFHFACLRNDPKVVEEFIKNGAHVNTPISSDAVFCPSYSPLHFAVESNCLENVKLLLEHGAVIDHKNGDNMTALHLAMYHDDWDNQKYTIFDHLYAKLMDKEVYLEDNYGMSYLHMACAKNDVKLIKKLLDNYHDVNTRIQHNPRKFANYTPLHFAVRYESLEAVELLIERGANVNYDDVDESGTALHLACEVGHVDMINLLLQNGASANVVRAKGQKTALHLIVESYMNRKNDRVSSESKSQLLPLVRKLVKFGVNVNARDQFNYTALHLACWKLIDGSPMVKKLLDAGANINLENIDEQTPLEMTYYESYRGNAEDYMTLYHHVQKLKILNYKVSPKNEIFCKLVLKEKNFWDPEHKYFKDKKLTRMEEQRRDEIEKMQSVRLHNPALTLYDLLVYNHKSLMIFADDHTARRIFEEKGLKKEYPVFANFLKLRYEKAVRQSKKSNAKVTKSRQFKRPRLR